MILLDSDVLIEILDKKSIKSQEIMNKLNQQEDEDLAISSLVLQEVLFGIFKKLDLKKLPTQHPLSKFPVIDFTKRDAELAAVLEVEMEGIGKKKPRGDILIAANAIRTGSHFFTLNHRHYKGISKLRLL